MSNRKETCEMPNADHLKIREKENNPPPTYLTAGRVRDRYGVSEMSLWRWLRDKALGFPHPIRINKRRFWKLSDLESWEAARTGTESEASVEA
jgi:predicted DNA-binding transcriptional regulator AlpA